MAKIFVERELELKSVPLWLVRFELRGSRPVAAMSVGVPKAVLKPPALQTLRAFRGATIVAKRLDCARLQRRFFGVLTTIAVWPVR